MIKYGDLIGPGFMNGSVPYPFDDDDFLEEDGHGVYGSGSSNDGIVP